MWGCGSWSGSWGGGTTTTVTSGPTVPRHSVAIHCQWSTGAYASVMGMREAKTSAWVSWKDGTRAIGTPGGGSEEGVSVIFWEEDRVNGFNGGMVLGEIGVGEADGELD